MKMKNRAVHISIESKICGKCGIEIRDMRISDDKFCVQFPGEYNAETRMTSYTIHNCEEKKDV